MGQGGGPGDLGDGHSRPDEAFAQPREENAIGPAFDGRARGRRFIGRGVDDFGDHVVRLDALPESGLIDNHASRRCLDDIGCRKRCRLAARGWQWRRRSFDQSAPHEEAVKAVRIRHCRLIVHVRAATQFHRRRLASDGNGVCRAETRVKLDPRQAVRLVERLAARTIRQKGRPAAEFGRKVRKLGPKGCGTIDVQQRVIVAMEVEHNVGVD